MYVHAHTETPSTKYPSFFQQERQLWFSVNFTWFRGDDDDGGGDSGGGYSNIYCSSYITSGQNNNCVSQGPLKKLSF